MEELLIATPDVNSLHFFALLVHHLDMLQLESGATFGASGCGTVERLVVR